MKINDDGLAISKITVVESYGQIKDDLFVMACCYVAASADSIQDNQPDPSLFAFLQKTLDLMNHGLDYEVLDEIFLKFRFYLALVFL